MAFEFFGCKRDKSLMLLSLWENACTFDILKVCLSHRENKTKQNKQLYNIYKSSRIIIHSKKELYTGF